MKVTIPQDLPNQKWPITTDGSTPRRGNQPGPIAVSNDSKSGTNLK